MPTDFRETGSEREKHINMREKQLSVIPYMYPDQGPKPQPRYVSQLGNWTHNFFFLMDNAPINWATHPKL